MHEKGVKIGFALTGSHCTLAQVIKVLKDLSENATHEITPIFSEAVYTTDTKFGLCSDWIKQVESITNKKIIYTIKGAEPIGPQKMFDCLVVAPCTGNTLAKICFGITDSTVPMAVKAHLRNQRPVVIAIATNDGLAANAKNIGLLLNRKNIYFVPFGQDDPIQKPNSLIADFTQISDTIALALQGKQIQPVLLKTKGD